MKKYLPVVLSVLLVLSLLTGCSGTVQSGPGALPDDQLQHKVALITGVGGIADRGFNASVYSGIQEFSVDYGIPCSYYEPSGSTEEDAESVIRQALEDQNDVIVLAGALYAKACLKMSRENPSVLFLGIAFSPSDMGTAQAPGNVTMLLHKEEQAGFLAGYAAVADGYRDLGFIGGAKVPAVVRFGYGYIQGAEKAAAALGVEDIRIKHWYSGTFAPNEEIEQKAAAWYDEGTEVIFSCGGAIYESVLKAANLKNGLLIGVDVDQSEISPRFITSAVKDLQTGVVMALSAAVKNNMNWPSPYAGSCQSLGVMDDCVGLAIENSRFHNFSPEMYDVLYKAIVNASITVDNNCDAYWHPQTELVSIDWQ